MELRVYELLTRSLLFLFLVWYLRYHWNRLRLYQMAGKIPGPVSLPLIGNALYFAVSSTKVLPKLLKTMERFRSPIRMWFGQQLAVILWHPRDIEIVLNNSGALEKEKMVYRHYEFLLGNGLGTAPVKIWKRSRRMITPTFKQQNINGFIPVFEEQSRILVGQLREHVGAGMFDCFSRINRCTMDMICETALGVKINSQTTESEIMKVVDDGMHIVSEKIARIWYHVDFIFEKSEMSRQLVKKTKQYTDFIDEIIEKWKKEADTGDPESETDKPKTFLQQLLKLSENGVSFNRKELRDEVITFILTGSDTTGSTLAFLLVVLGLFPEVQERVRQEILDVVGENRPIEPEDLSKLDYTERVIKETLRIFPVGLAIARSNSDEIKLDSCTIPARTAIAIMILGLHRNPDVWEDPLRFDPDRFLPEEVAKRHPYSWLPFSGGPRNCIGVKYAWTSVKVLVITLLRNYKFTTSYKSIEDVRVKHNITLRTVDGYNIGVEPRT